MQVRSIDRLRPPAGGCFVLVFCIGMLSFGPGSAQEDRSRDPGQERQDEPKIRSSAQAFQFTPKLGEKDLRPEPARIPALSLMEGTTYTYALQAHPALLDHGARQPGRGGEAGRTEGQAPGPQDGKPQEDKETERRDPAQGGAGRPGGGFASTSKEVSFRVVKATADGWMLEASCASREPSKTGSGAEARQPGAESSREPGAAARRAEPFARKGEVCSFTVTKAGQVECCDKEGKAVSAAHASAEAAHLKTHLQHVFGYKLHDQMFQPGQEITMPGSPAAFTGDAIEPAPHRSAGDGGTRSPTEKPRTSGGTDPGRGAEDSDRPKTAAATEGREPAGSHIMLYQGTATLAGKRVACFAIQAGNAGDAGKSGKAPKSPGSSGAKEAPGDIGPERAAGRAEAHGEGRTLARAAYSLDEGLLEQLVANGISVRRERSAGSPAPGAGN